MNNHSTIDREKCIENPKPQDRKRNHEDGGSQRHPLVLGGKSTDHHDPGCVSLTLALPGTQHGPRSGILLLRVRAEQPVKLTFHLASTLYEGQTAVQRNL